VFFQLLLRFRFFLKFLIFFYFLFYFYQNKFLVVFLFFVGLFTN